MHDTPKLLMAKDGPLGWITFNQPEKRNAVSQEMWQLMPDYVQELAEDDAIRVVILRGAGEKVFVAGADIFQFKDRRRNMEEYVREYALTISRNALLTMHAAKANVTELLRPSAQRDVAKLERLMAACFDSEGYQEGVRAFSEKRRPVFQGR